MQERNPTKIKGMVKKERIIREQRRKDPKETMEKRMLTKRKGQKGRARAKETMMRIKTESL